MTRKATLRLLLLAPALLAAGCASGGGIGRPGGGLFGSATIDPATLMGRSPAEVAATLGQPELKRSEPPAEIWQYRTENCVFDVYMFADGGQPKVVHTEARHRSEGTVSAAGCLGSVAAARGTRPPAG